MTEAIDARLDSKTVTRQQPLLGDIWADELTKPVKISQTPEGVKKILFTHIPKDEFRGDKRISVRHLQIGRWIVVGQRQYRGRVHDLYRFVIEDTLEETRPILPKLIPVTKGRDSLWRGT